MITTQELVDKVLMLLNEPGVEPSITLLSEDTCALSDTVQQLLPDAVLFVQNNKAFGALNPKACSVAPSQITEHGDGSGVIELPDDFVALVELHLDGWERSCTFLQPQGSALALAQGNKYTRAGRCKPVCVDGVNAQGKRVVNYYSLPVDKNVVVDKFVYEAVFNPQEGLSCEQGNPLVWAVVYQCAGLVYNVFERRDSANAFMALAVAWCKNGKIE